MFRLLIFLAGCAPQLGRRQLEAEMLGRVVGAFQSDSYEVEHRHGRKNVLSPDLYDERYQFQVRGETHQVVLSCWDGFRSRRHGWIRPRCQLEDYPPLDRRAPSLQAAELVALRSYAQDDFWADGESLTLQRRSDGKDHAYFVMRARRRERTFHVRCSTDDPTQATRRCTVEAGPLTDVFDEAAHAPIRYVSCVERGGGYGVLESPDGPFLNAPDTVDRMKELLERFRVDGVKTLGGGSCCPTAERPGGWCVRVHLLPQAARAPILGQLADRLRDWEGPKPRLLVTGYDEVIPLRKQ